MSRKKKPVGKTILFGALTVGLYAAVFTHGTAVAHYFARGTWHLIFPIITVFVFSYVHGSFAHNLWTLLGIEARKTALQVEKEKRAALRKRPRPQLRAQAR